MTDVSEMSAEELIAKAAWWASCDEDAEPSKILRELSCRLKAALEREQEMLSEYGPW